MILNDRIREWIEARGYTYRELASMTGINAATIHRYASGAIAKIPADKLQVIARALNVSSAYLMGWTDEPSTTISARASDLAPVSVTRIPILGRISAGLPLYAEEHIEGYTVTDLNHGAEYYALRVHGDSMNAAGINEGDLVVVRRQEEVEDGDIAIVLVDHEDATVKRWHQSGNIVQLIPCSTNPENVIQFYDIKKTEVSVIGKVVVIQKFI